MRQQIQACDFGRKLSTLAALFWLSIPLLLGQPNVEARLSPEEIRIGEQPTYTLTVTAQPEISIDSVDLSVLEQLVGVEILQQQLNERTGQGQLQMREYKLTLTAFEAGRYDLPPVPVRYTLKGEQAVAWSNELSLLVNTLPVETDSTQLRPLKDIAAEPLNFWDVLPYLIGILIGALVLGLVWYWLRQGKDRPAPVKPPRRIALQAYTQQKLDELEQQQLWQKGEVKAYHDRLTYILREYLGYRFDIPALENTTDEIYRALSGQAISREVADQLYQLLQTADLVKFAKAEPPASFHAEALDRVRGFVRQAEDEWLVLAIYESGKTEVYRKPNPEENQSQTAS
ncbi:MAG: hypothetical protein GVY26_19140 [Bacteroidetes bacterium]|jgi:hypothetical protein|nr:hypothetical protein [Bacteroidota bacterium]